MIKWRLWVKPGCKAKFRAALFRGTRNADRVRQQCVAANFALRAGIADGQEIELLNFKNSTNAK